MRSIKTTFTVVVPNSLWRAVEGHAKLLYEQSEKKATVSHLFEIMAMQLAQDPKPLPIAPNRRVTNYSKASDYGEEFPQSRSSLSIDPNVLQNLYEAYEKKTKEQFGEDASIDANTLAVTVFYHYCVENNLEIDEKFFDDEYFKKHYSYNDDQTLESLRMLANMLGKFPTSREWRERRHQVGGPSESYIVNRFGSFSKAKQLAELNASPGTEEPSRN
ncbi:homing endonuclease associated repeat-containing protein [Paenibacillus aestuarii]|uniref:Homing endonuclease associated repeat-containing protein n=1 Tax=Paenibacillus aestuarii TaxID=516965 RepID=A0ABW0KIW7_9BACL